MSQGTQEQMERALDKAASSNSETRAPESVRQSELLRCDQEITDIRSSSEGKPAWLVTLGVEDWEMEKRMINFEAISDDDLSNLGESFAKALLISRFLRIEVARDILKPLLVGRSEPEGSDMGRRPE